MIKKISSGEKNTASTNEANKPDARNVSNEAVEQFSSLVNKKGTLFKGVSKPQKLNRSLDKIENELAKQVGQVKTADQQTPAGKTAQVGQTKTTDRQTLAGETEQVGQAKTADRQTLAGETEQVGQAKTADRQTPADKTALSADKQKSNDQEALPQSLDAFDIASMIAQNHAPLQSAAPVEEVSPAPPVDLSKIVGEIADRILVSSPADNPSGMQEIRIHLKESVLPNTEVRIYRHAGSLQVEFLTGSKDSQMFIEQRQPDIQKILGERLTNETVNVSVQDSQQARGGQGEGRSRQQYINPDLDDDGN